MSNGERREVKQELPDYSGNQRPDYPSGGGHSAFTAILKGFSILSTVLTLFAIIGRGCDDKPHVIRYDAPQLQWSPPEPTVPYMAMSDVKELENYLPEDTAFIKRSSRITTMHIPAIERAEPDAAIIKQLRKYSNLAQVRTLYMQVDRLGMELEALNNSVDNETAAPVPADRQKDIRKLTRQVKEYTYDATKRADGALMKEPLLQKISADAKAFNSRILKQLGRCSKLLSYLSECVRQQKTPEADELGPLVRDFKKDRIDATEFERHENRLRRYMIKMSPSILEDARISDGRRQTLHY